MCGICFCEFCVFVIAFYISLFYYSVWANIVRNLPAIPKILTIVHFQDRLTSAQCRLKEC